MTDKSQLPFLLKLLDDPSPRVQSKVRHVLRGFGSDLTQHVSEFISKSGLEMSEQQLNALDEICTDCDTEQDDFATLWRAVQTSDDEWFKLESAFAFLARWQFKLENEGLTFENLSLRHLLDDLADGYRATGENHEAISLANWLFEERGFGGTTMDKYYDPLNCNLVHVLQTGEGLPISLAVIFMLIGHRLDVEVHGCAFPSHFLARAGDTFFDCYNGGRVLEERESLAILKVMPDAMLPSCAAPIVARAIFNLINAYQHNAEYDKARQCLSLLEQLKNIETTI